jgi:hypothetical protein
MIIKVSKKIKILFLIIKVKLKTNFNISFKLAKFYSRWEVISDSVDDSIEFHNCNKATFKNLSKFKKSNTLFILGSGPSINLVSERNWEKIAKADSIGFNKFMAHNFVPTFYHSEAEMSYLDTTIEVFNIRKKDFKNIPIIFNAWHWDIINNGIKDLNFLNKENLYFSIPRRYTGLNENELSDMLYKIYNNILYRKETFLFHHSSSLILMITFAVMMQYKEIVLIGFDLYDNNYFYLEKNIHLNDCVNVFYKKSYDTYTANKTNQHLTTQVGKVGNISENNTIDTFKIVKKNVLDPLEIKIYSASKKSLLNEFIDPYENFFV